MADTGAAFVIERLMEWGVFQIYSYPGGGINEITAALC
jgi:thiamine pyrophosphate-dependent acetolactate synthase large subunit-like protein